MRRDEFNQIQQLRMLVPVDADRNLSNWGAWRRGGQYVRGYPTHSTLLENLGGCASADASDHVYEALNNWRAEVADAVIDALAIQHKIAISYVYEASVWQFNRLKIEDVIVAAANEFWGKAKIRGLT